MRQLAVARLWHEGNSFSPVPTTLADFHRREWVAGTEALSFYRGTATEMGAVAAFAERRADWRVTVLRSAAAAPGGPLDDAAFAAIRDELLSGLSARCWDAVYLSLHGALVTERRPTPEFDLLREIRSLIGGGTPIGISLDLHANVGPQFLDLVDIAVGYKTYPHTDMEETAARVLRLLVDQVEGRIRPTGAMVKVGSVLPSFNMRTGDGPMAEVADRARGWEARPGVLDATPLGGFAYGDSPFAGAAAMVHTDGDPALALAAAEDLAAALRRRRDRFFVTLPDAEEGLARALAAGDGPVAVLDPADNPLSGGIGDTPGLFRSLLKARPRVPTVFAFFWDPALVAAAHAAGPGGALSCRLGGRLTPDYGPPVTVEATVIRLTDGRFRNIGPMETNLPVALGRTAVLEVEGIRVIVTESCQAPNDPAYFALHGIDPATTRLLCVKAKNHFRAAFAPICSTIIEIDAPGPASADLGRYRFRHLPPELLPPGPASERS